MPQGTYIFYETEDGFFRGQGTVLENHGSSVLILNELLHCREEIPVSWITNK